MTGTGLRRIAMAIGLLSAAPALASGFAGPVSTIQAVLLGATATITVNARSGGGTASGLVSSTDTTPAISCNSGSTLNCSGTVTFTTSATVTLTATPGPTAASPTWVGCTSVVGNVCTATITGNRSITATFPPNTWPLTVRQTRSGAATGTVTAPSTPDPVNCTTVGPCTSNVATGQVVDLTATPGPNSGFTGWSGACTGTGACSVAMTAAKSVTAAFAPAAYSVSVAFFGGSGTVTSTGGVAPSINCTTPGTGTCSGGVVSGGSMVLTATPDALSDFLGWSGACTGTATQCTLSGVNSNRQVTASFQGKTCNSCHGSPPPLPHSQIPTCDSCHAGYTAQTVNPALHMNGQVDAPTLTCSSCHGDAARTGADPYLAAAPPAGTLGETATTDHAVGAHMAHLTAGSLASAFACTDCHSPPLSTNHGNGVVEFSWSVLARGTGVPSYDTVTFSCSTTYCHGNFTNGNTANAPVWTSGAAGAACGSCHGLPPGGTHPQNAACETCHTGYTVSTVNPALHVNGLVDLGSLSCTSCHGSGANAAPPVDAHGGSATTSNSVGAHQAHVASTLRTPIACTECHGSASGSYTTSHADGTVQIAFGALANRGTATQWTAASSTCASNYCHGATTALAGGTATVPVWTQVGGNTFKSCTSCHGAPPPAPHVQRSDCGSCHSGYTSTTVVASTHVNGAVESSGMTCSSCHGGVANAAPPRDVAGNTATTTMTVGAHQAHVAGTLRPAIACSECHGAASASYGTGHADGSLQVSFGTLSNQGTSTVWSAGAGTCAASYCHGGSPALQGGIASTPVWNRVDGTYRGCTSCHGAPPPAPHVQNAECGSCHSGYTVVSVNPVTHVNGTVDHVALTCSSCHGDALRTGVDPNIAAMPPRGTAGETLTSQAAVGAHQAHLSAGALANAFACTDCHNPPLSTNHASGAVEFSWSVLAKGGGTPSYDTAAKTCSNTYCHGSFTNGATANAPVWTAGASGAACGSCHGLPPGGTHPQSSACGSCHGVGYSSTSVVAATHVNGLLDVSAMSCTSCHGTAGRVSVASADANQAVAPPVVASATGVAGVHLAHVNQGATAPALSNAMACVNCHVMPSSNAHSDGTIGVTYASLAVAQGAVPTAYNPAAHTCSNTYCHGNFPGGNQSATALSWSTAGKLGCTACHGNPPALSAASHHPANANCATCHGAGNTASTVVAATHVNGTVTLSRSGCTLCHGDLTLTGVPASNPALAAPGVNANSADTTGATAATSAAVGAHAAHIAGTRWRQTPVGCVECHVVPADGNVTHATGVGSGGARATVAFGALATTGSITTAAYAGSTTASGANGAGTCSNTYCHGNFRNGATTATPSWLGGAAAAACGSCHGLPPGGTHPASSACESCHTGYTSSTVNVALHLNGAVDVLNLTCTSCHGTASRASVAGADVNQASAPPLDSHNQATGVLVGTHVSHVNPAAVGAVYKPVACSECHPNNAGNTSHSNNVVNVTFAAATAANLGGLTATFAQGNGTTTQTTCTTYCHGATLSTTTTQNTTRTWTWNGAAADCGSCHRSPPGTANHHNAVALSTCNKCHSGTVDAAGVVNVAGGLHVNGAVNTSTLACNTCHGNATLVASGLQDTNVAAAPTGAGAPDTYGNTTAAFKGVGVHASHVIGTRSRPVLCNACHASVATQIHKTGVVTAGTVVLANLSTTGGIATASYSTTGTTCSNTYCHGNLGGGIGATNVTPAWTTAATLVCNSCHGMPPASTSTGRFHPNRTDCGACHAGYTGTTVNATTHVDGTVQYTTQTCTTCHGDPARTGSDANLVAFSSAPPVDATNASTGAKVGAHVKHLLTGAAGGPSFSRQVACSECHSAAIPATPLHANGLPNVAFGTLARTGAVTPSYTGNTCSNTYCHGNFTNGAGANAITWNAGAITCNSCHGTPPGGTHPAGSTLATCGNCHGNYSNATQSIIDPAGHVDGTIDVGAMSCTSCHGTSGRTSVAGADLNQAVAPPVVASATGVAGVHLAHVNQGATAPALSNAMACVNCHVMPSSNAHSDGTIGVTYANLAVAQGAVPTAYNGAAHTCSNTYCHGNFPGGNQSATALSWSTAGKLGCTACHGNPPALSAASHHPANANCATCHGAGNTASTVVAATHVNGTVTLSRSGCTLCHGDLTLTGVPASNPALAAPGLNANSADTTGATAATSAAVGAHAAHIAGTRWRQTSVGCVECHVVPADGNVAHATGVGSGGARATVAFGTLARTGGITTAGFGGSTTGANGNTPGTCSNTYCHGNFANGAGANALTWTAGTTAAACGSCHGLPPGGTHPTSSACESCHTGYTISTVNASLHLNGAVDVSSMSCTSCHGGVNAAPPVDTHGGTATTLVSVGAHQAHVASTLRDPIACTECHGASSSSYTPTHSNSVVDMGFGTLANQGTTTVWNAGAATCASTYCHGGTTALVGGTGTTPVWTQVNGTFKGCASCHGAPPSGTHPTSTNCVACHPGYTATAVNAPTHVDGTVNYTLTTASCALCHGAPPATASHRTAGGITTCSRCHDTSVDASGNILTGGTHRNGAVNLSASMSCATCHGDPTRTPNPTSFVDGVTSAPPVDLSGNTTAAARGVGAHLAHVNGTRSKNLLCSDCHDITTSFQGYGHANGVTEMAWGTLATLGGAAPTYTLGSGGSCNATYCHGNFSGSGSPGTSPTWTTAGTLACNSCHGAPPALSAQSHHPANAACVSCHGVGYSATTVVQATHVDGTVNVSRTGCTACHGDLTQTGVAASSAAAAPGYNANAADTTGATAATAAAVGAHAAHLTGSRWRGTAIACNECHTVPSASDVTHATGAGTNGARATVTFGTLARTGSITTAAYAGSTTGTGGNAAGTCSNVYCHGNFTNGATAAAPSWLGGAAAAACGSCHGLPPGGTHPTSSACESCHTGYTISSVNLTAHLNGAVDVLNLACTSCHGTAGRASVAGADVNQAASPPAVASATGVAGVHLAHVNQGATAPALSNALACVNCHTVPTVNAHSDGAIGVTYASISVAQGAVPTAYNTTAHTCSNTYCHGNFPGGNQGATAISWSTAGKLGCTACHGNPPAIATHHPANTNCVACHTGYSSTTVTAATHVDGTVQKPLNGCTACHGVLAGQAGAAVANTSATSAPGFNASAVDASGSALTTSRGVGAHLRHLTPTLRSAGLSCTECHGPIPAANDTLHANGTVAVAWGTLATTRSSVPTTSVAGPTLSCSATWCHGGNAALSGATAATIAWNANATVNCTSCHGNPPTGLGHPNNTNCASCHGTGYTYLTATTGSITLGALATHIDGTITVTTPTTCTSCHGATGRVSVAGADLNQASSPPADTLGAATGVRVGTHLGHVNPAAGGAVYKPVACSECHPNVTTNNHGNNVVNVTFATATGANLGAFTPTFVQGNGTTTQTTCATYCHGSSLNATTTQNTTRTWTWNGAAADCGSCHRSPPGTANHHNAAALSTCNKCHSGTVDAAGVVNVAGGLHVNGAINTSTLACNTCHGNATLVASGLQDTNVAAAPTGAGAPDTYGNTTAAFKGVGVHASHVIGTRSRPVLCNACHASVATQIHKTGVVTAGTVVLANLSTTGGIATASYSTTGTTCSNTYCHGNLGGGVGATNVTPAWTTAATLVCNSCHGMPPSTTSTGRFHPNRTDCGACHAGYTGTTVNATTHVDGTVQYTTQTCTTCHGDPARTGSDANLVAFSSAPPVDAANASTGAKVGAHVKHLLTGAAGGPSFSRQVACSECHSAAIPATPLHANGLPNVAFGTLARTGAVTPSYTGSTCSNTYCHGNFTNGAGANAITWNAGAITCNSCHGTPPGGTHPAGSTLATCGNCHGNYSNATSSIIDPAGHVNGTVDLSNMSCTSCHGAAGRTSVAGADLNQASSPPLDTAGLATSARVGTHISHVNPAAVGAVYKAIACTECHPNNTSNAHSNALRDVVFPVGGAARLSGYAAGFTLGNGTTQTTCATYCHGASLNATTIGSVGATWSWNSAVAADCGSCHRLTPGTANHHNAAAVTTCSKCHSGTVNAAGAVLVAGNLHVNGAIDTSTLACNTCHGNATLVASGLQDTNVAAAPTGTGAPDTYGNLVATARGVGVHASHVLGTRSRPVLCNACHAVPTIQIHKTGAVTTGTVALGNLSVTGGITTASYSTTGTTCSNTYCHGNLGGGVGATNVTPAWTTAATLGCTGCHGSPPTTTSTGRYHPQRTDCGSCHAGYGATTVNATTHVDGTIQFTTQTCTTCHGNSGRASVAGADANQASAPPADSHGSSSSALVGMHLAHVNPAASAPGGTQPTGGVYRPIACTECHPNNATTTHANGTVNLDFTGATGARLNGFAAAFTQGNGSTVATTCSTWCHGAGLGTSYQGTTIVPAWNGAAATCGSCHGFPPSTTAHNGPPVVAQDSKACASCHSATVNPDGTINVAGGRHINGVSDAVKGNTCSGCHDFGMAAATTYHHVMATDPTAAYPTSNGPAIADADRNCNMCHMKHEFPNAATNLRNTVNSATPTASNTDTALCISCHEQNLMTKDAARQRADGTTQTPRVDSLGFTGSAHDYLVDGAFGANGMQVNCVKCHNSDSTPTIQTGTNRFALHSSADRRLRAPLGRATLTDDDSANFCYRCHSATTDTALTGTKKTATANDWYGKVTTMPAGATGIFAQMQKGTAAAPAGSTTTTNTLYFKPSAAETPSGTLPTAHLSTTDTFQGGTFVARSMSPGATTTAYESQVATNNSVSTGTQYWRRVSFVSPPVATAFTTPASAWTINVWDRESSSNANARVRYAIYTIATNGTLKSSIVARANGGTEMSTTAAPGTLQTITTAAGSAVAVAAGDRIVVDLEIVTLSVTTAGTSYQMTYFFGNGAASSVVMPSAATFTYASAATPASGRHDVGAYTGLHRPNPAEEHLQYIAANKHVDCADCHDPHRSKRGNQGDAGTVTAGVTGCTNTTTTLCNTAATWPVDAWKGYFLDIYNATTGAIIGNRVQITANTATQLTLASTTGTAPASGNAYRISMRANGGAVTAATTSTLSDTQSAVGGAKAWATNAFAGWYVHIVFGVGIGQTAPILSNTATQLTINGTWTTTPTTASRYVISKMPNVMLGASGANVTAWGTQTPSAWGETKTFNPAAGSTTALPDATTQWQACFKCHSAANTALATWNASYTDLAQDFNPRNQSYHPVIAPSATNATSGYGNTILTAADMTNGWKPGDMMTCTDCHGNDDQGTGASHGPHASAVKYILKGPNTRWPFQANGTTRWTYGTRTTGQGTADGLFCLNCHSATLRSTPHSNQSQHNVACTACHIRLPHGGKVKRLIRTTNTPAPYADTGVAASLSAYNGGTSTNSCAAGCTSTHSATNLPANTTTAPVNAW